MRRRTKILRHINWSVRDSKKAHFMQMILEIESKTKHTHERERDEREARVVANIKTNPKAFYSFAKEDASVRYKIEQLINDDGSLTADTQAISEILNAQYKNVFTSPLQHLQINMPKEFFRTIPQTGGKASTGYFIIEDDDEVSDIDEMNPNSATGPDGFPVILLEKMQKGAGKAS